MVCLLSACWALAAQAAQTESSPLVINATVPKAMVGVHFELPLNATGGAHPYLWRVLEGELPPGLKLHPHSGAISGVPTTAGEYHFTIAVMDSGYPQQNVKRAFTITVTSAVSIDWKEYPAVHGNTISGSVVVANDGGQPLDVTVIVVAVNDIGRATALGYQHFIIAAQNPGQVIPFGSSPGPGSYVVHADAIAHRPGKEHIFRARKQTADPLQITQQ